MAFRKPPCKHCKLEYTEKITTGLYAHSDDSWGMVDPCLGRLDGVAHCCCGHGKAHSAYVIVGGDPGQRVYNIPNPVALYGSDALAFFAARGVGPNAAKK